MRIFVQFKMAFVHLSNDERNENSILWIVSKNKISYVKCMTFIHTNVHENKHTHTLIM